MRVVWTRRATRHLHAAYDYWAREKSGTAADKMLDRIFAAVEVLEDHPQLGRPGRISGTRELVVAPTPFVVAYGMRRHGVVEVVALLHGARKCSERF